MSLDHIGKLPEVDQWESTTFAWETQDEDNIPGHQDLIDDGNAALTAADRHVAALEAAMTAKATPGVEDDVLADWEDFWREIVCPNGPLDLAQVARELFDYHVAMKQVAIVYCDITGNRFSKPNTSASHVIDAAYEYIEKPLLARIAELEELSKTSICIFCGTTMDKDLTVMLEHAKGCEKRPENRLTVRIAELETENREQQRILDMVAHPGSAEYATMQAKAALAEKDLSYREAATRAVDAEAALAEQDRILGRIAEGHFPGLPQAQQMWLDTYRVEARAKEGSVQGHACPDCGQNLLYGTGHLNCPGRAGEGGK